MKSLLTHIALISLTLNLSAQNFNPTNGTELADNLDSSSRVVVDSFLNSSGRVDVVISNRLSKYSTTQDTEDWVARQGYLTADTIGQLGYATEEYVSEKVGDVIGDLVNGSLKVNSAENADTSDISFALKDDDSSVMKTAGEIFSALDSIPDSFLTTNDVCNIVTNEIMVRDWYADGAYVLDGPDFQEHFGIPATVIDFICYTNATDVPSAVKYILDGFVGESIQIDEFIPIYSALYSIDEGDIGGEEGKTVTNLVATSMKYYPPYFVNTNTRMNLTSDAGDYGIYFNRDIQNALGLARMSDIYYTIGLATNITQYSLGEFSRTGTVYKSDVSETATYAGYANEADSAHTAFCADSIRDTETETTREGSLIIQQLDAAASTNYANTAAENTVANADTTYRRTIGITNLNQTVQYVNITNATPTTLAITMPTNGMTKDWIVYVSSVTNVTLSLPAATWWMADAAYTNEVPPATPTAFYFSQIAEGIFYLGRQELTEVAAP